MLSSTAEEAKAVSLAEKAAVRVERKVANVFETGKDTDGDDRGSSEDGTENVLEMGRGEDPFLPHCLAAVWPHIDVSLPFLCAWLVERT